MSTAIHNWEGNIGSAPEHRSFPNGNNPPRNLLRLNVFFDNSIPDGSGGFKDRGGFWCQVEFWHPDAERYAALLKKGMRVTVQGRALMDTYQNRDDETVSVLKVEANRVAILPHRVTDIVLAAPTSASNTTANAGNAPRPAPSEPTSSSQTSTQADYDDFDDDLPY